MAGKSELHWNVLGNWNVFNLDSVNDFRVVEICPTPPNPFMGMLLKMYINYYAIKLMRFKKGMGGGMDKGFKVKEA